MDSALRCNDLKCRNLLNNQAVVTTCSHIFCLPCADHLELTAPKDGQRKCPACQTYLLNPDDAVVTSLNPSEDYKTSILSGLSPTVIIECAGRGLQFWAYQLAQEITYQEFLGNSLKTRYGQLGQHFDAVVREANEENGKLLARIEALQAQDQSMKEKVHQMEIKLKEKDKAYNQINNMYQKAKGHLMYSGLEQAADEDAEEIVQTGTQFRNSQAQHPGRRPHRAGSNGSGEHERVVNQSSQFLPPGLSSQMPRATQSSHTAPLQTPSHRQRLPPQSLAPPAFGHYNFSNTQNTASHLRHDSLRHGTPMGASQVGRAVNPGRGYGMSSNARMGRTQGSQGQAFRSGQYAPVATGRPPYFQQ